MYAMLCYANSTTNNNTGENKVKIETNSTSTTTEENSNNSSNISSVAETKEEEEVEDSNGNKNDKNKNKKNDEKLPSYIINDIKIKKLTRKQAQERAKESQIELDDARASLNDLIAEIESVSAEEVKAREQCARVVRQMNDSQSMQRGVLEENFKLHDQIVELQKKQSEVDSRYVYMYYILYVL